MLYFACIASQPQNPQWKLFKTHEDKLGTARHGITSMTSTRQEKATTKSSIRHTLSALGRLFRGRGLDKSSQYSESKLSIDYEQFCIRAADGDSQDRQVTAEDVDRAPAPVISRLTEGKRFSESHINPDISFTVEGRLPETEELVLTDHKLPYTTRHSPEISNNSGQPQLDLVDNDLYKVDNSSGSSGHSELTSHPNAEPLPVTCIDDVIDVSSDFETYEQVR